MYINKGDLVKYKYVYKKDKLTLIMGEKWCKVTNITIKHINKKEGVVVGESWFFSTRKTYKTKLERVNCYRYYKINNGDCVPIGYIQTLKKGY